jgi:hypothetical protein
MAQALGVEFAFHGHASQALDQFASNPQFLCQTDVAACYEFVTNCEMTALGLVEPMQCAS